MSMQRLGEHTFVETDKQGAKPVKSTRMMMMQGSTMTIDLIVIDMVRGRTVTYVADKQ